MTTLSRIEIPLPCVLLKVLWRCLVSSMANVSSMVKVDSVLRGRNSGLSIMTPFSRVGDPVTLRCT